MSMHPDVKQDTALTMSLMKQELTPIFQTLVSRLEMLEQENAELKKMTGAIVDGFGEAVTNHRRGTLASSLDLGEDYDDINNVYKDFEGSDLKDDFINYVLENDVSDDQLEEMKNILMENARGKYGKYQPKPQDMAIKIDAGPVEEVAPEVMESGEKSPAEEAGKKKKPADEMYEKLMSQHRAARGAKI